MGRVACKVKMQKRKEESPHPPCLSGFQNPVWVARLCWSVCQEKAEVSGFLILRIAHPQGRSSLAPLYEVGGAKRAHPPFPVASSPHPDVNSVRR